jgi:Zn-dependent M28 family amino/carboxypeptidase
MMTKRRIVLYLSTIGLLLLLLGLWYIWAFILYRQSASTKFDGNRAYNDVKTQVSFGPRIPGSDAHAKVLDWLRTELESKGLQVQIQQSQSLGHPIQNLVAYRSEQPPQFILGAHYDSRIFADHDPDPLKQNQPTPGANNGASGVAVLLELARSLPANTPPVWLVFFDAEDDGKIPGWDWILGSKAFVNAMTIKPKAMVLVDMVGGTDSTFYMDGNSDRQLSNSIWDTAAKLGYKDIFIPQIKYNILDDHIPFIQAGIPSVDIIDIDDKYWLTASDTPDHVSPKSLQIVGSVLWTWLTQQETQSN